MALAGKIVVFTGTLNMKRADATKMAKDAGATVTGSVSGNTNILVCGVACGSKRAQAEAKGVTCWTEDEFVKQASGGGKKEPPAAAAGKKVVAKKAATPKPPAKKATKTAAATPAPDDEDEDDAPPKKVSKTAAGATPAGSTRRPVDRLVPGREGYTIFEDWSVTLNQTNIGGNNNKYYIIQLLENKGDYWTWNRWGRVGEPGQNKLEKCPSLDAAKKQFEGKFRDKTKNAWAAVAKKTFVSHDGKYTLVETEEKEDSGSGDAAAPMGKLSKAQIEKGQEVLVQLSDAIEKKAKSDVLNSLSSTFFTLIPTNFGRRRPEPITTMDELHKKEELLKFYLRMGFEEVEDSADTSLTPIDGVMKLKVPATLKEAISNCCPVSAINNSVNQGKKLAAKNAGTPKEPMNQEHYGSIMLYTSNAIYRDLNKVLRDEKRKAVEKYFGYLRLLFDATNRLVQKNVQLFRGISVDLSSQYKVGHTITWWGVSSCTSDQSVARNFMNGCGGDCTLLTIATKTAVDISAITFYSNEKESLLLPGTQLLVKKSSKKGKIAEIELEEVGRVVS